MSEKKTTSSVPLIVRQRNRHTGRTRALPYEPSAETYDIFKNPKNPFLERLITARKERSQLRAEQLERLFEKLDADSPYRLSYATAVTAHKKRKIAPGTTPSKSAHFPAPESLREATPRLQHFLQLFMAQVLQQLQEDPFRLPQIVNELVPLFEEQGIRLRIYDAYRQFHSFDQLLDTLGKISEDYEIENFELFCSALFGFYSQLES
jgi:hypothetical protein